MKQIDNYIIEKLHLNKDTKISQSSKFLFCVPYNEIYDGLIEDFEDALIDTNKNRAINRNGFIVSNPNGFIITYSDAKEIIETYVGEVEKNVVIDDCHFYKIPNDYSGIKEFEEDYVNADIIIDDLEEISLDKLV